MVQLYCFQVYAETFDGNWIEKVFRVFARSEIGAIYYLEESLFNMYDSWFIDECWIASPEEGTVLW